jgi:hypothetical protein
MKGVRNAPKLTTTAAAPRVLAMLSADGSAAMAGAPFTDFPTTCRRRR